jgi:hypothetical protein
MGRVGFFGEKILKKNFEILGPEKKLTNAIKR